MHHDSSTIAPSKHVPGAERRRRRIARGLPPMTEAGLAAERRREQKRSKTRTKATYDRNRAFIDGIKCARGCVDCGYAGHPAALHFDHLPGTDKQYTIAQMTLHSSTRHIVAEMAKCEVVCANCHAIRHVHRREEKTNAATRSL